MDSSTTALLLCSLLWTVCAQAPVVSVEPRSAGVRQGESVSFRCRVVSGSQPVHLEWKRTNNHPLADNVKIGPDGSVLTIANTRNGNQGQYRCVATNSAGRSTMMASLTIKHSPKVRVTPAGPLRVRLGEPVALECHATGRPRPSVTWQRHRTQLVTTKTEDTSTLKVAAVSSEDAGVYVCQAQNTEGVAEIKVEVIVEGGQGAANAPKATVSMAEVTAVEGHMVTMQCQATGFHPTCLSWCSSNMFIMVLIVCEQVFIMVLIVCEQRIIQENVRPSICELNHDFCSVSENSTGECQAFRL
uniref:basement membrane-specific heparan sulfate proteoglycan core protein-like n=1 Tax=Oncorhynchus gorbuscha TaxID=8017 RepID=UPI001EAE9951|nr:basement membrane-specific heparan sulfate proteoglycan core protein-like [Oncorhynchus gorbuscha]